MAYQGKRVAARDSGGKHRAAPPVRHRAERRPKRGRLAIVGACVAVTATAVVGGFGVLPGGQGPSEAASSIAAGQQSGSGPEETAKDSAVPQGATGKARARTPLTSLADVDGSAPIAAVTESTQLPPRSGSGYRIVFSEGRQRVWLVDAEERVVRTYLVSGSIYDNLEPGTFEVFSRSRHAIGIDDSGTMEYFVRFTHGTQGAAIGFHTIPVDNGQPVQKRSELGTPLSHGCIRQDRDSAIALWEFAPIGTTVVVTD